MVILDRGRVLGIDFDLALDNLDLVALVRRARKD
jgi:hypothetical protein